MPSVSHHIWRRARGRIPKPLGRVCQAVSLSPHWLFTGHRKHWGHNHYKLADCEMCDRVLMKAGTRLNRMESKEELFLISFFFLFDCGLGWCSEDCLWHRTQNMTLGWSFPVERLTHIAVIECRWFGYETLFNLKQLWFISHWVLPFLWCHGFKHDTSFSQILLNAVLPICV